MSQKKKKKRRRMRKRMVILLRRMRMMRMILRRGIPLAGLLAGSKPWCRRSPPASS